MGAESHNEGPVESARSALEKFKGDPDAPFETVAKNEEPPQYPYLFLNKLKPNWSKVCQLMDWKVKGGQVDWNFFKVAKTPTQLVTAVQNKILEKGGSLPKYGVDGKFGDETQRALDSIFRGTEAKPERARPTLAEGPAPKHGIEQVSSKERLIQEKLQEAVKAMPRVAARLEAAGLMIDGDWLKGPDFSDTDVIEFQTRAMRLREDLITQEPRLAPLGNIATEAISIIEQEVRKIDLSRIHSMADLRQVFDQLGKTIESRMKTFDDIFSEKDMEALIKEVDIEILMVFFGSVVHELVVQMSKYFKENKENFERLMKIFEEDFLIRFNHLKSQLSQRDDNSTVRLRPEAATNLNVLASRGVVASGRLEFSSNEIPVVLDLGALTLTVGAKTAKLVLPEGIKLDSVEAMQEGSLALNISVGGFSTTQIIDSAQLGSDIRKILATPSGGRIEMGQGAYLQLQ